MRTFEKCYLLIYEFRVPLTQAVWFRSVHPCSNVLILAMPGPITQIKSERQKPMILCDGYAYNKNKVTKQSVTIWNCQCQRNGCKASIETLGAGADLILKAQLKSHSHEADQDHCARLRIQHQIRETSQTSVSRERKDIVADLIGKTPDIDKVALPKTAPWKRLLCAH